MSTLRQQHYQFSHNLLPSLFHDNPYRAVGQVTGAEGEMALFTLWSQLGNRTGDNLPHLGPATDPTTGSMEMVKLEHVGRVVKGNHSIWFVAMPPPEAPGESYYVALVQHWPDGVTLVPEYFVWDRTVEEGKANLARYDANGMRVAMGIHDQPTLDGFAAALAEQFELGDFRIEPSAYRDGGALHQAMMDKASAAGLTSAPPKKRKAGRTFIGLIVGVGILGLMIATLVIGALELGTDLKRPGKQVASKKVEDGDKFKLSAKAPKYGVAHDTVWLRTYGAKTEDGKFTLRGKIGCSTKKKRKLKKVRISSTSKKKTHRIEEDRDSIDGWFKLGTWKTRAGKKLTCSGALNGSPGKLDHSLVVITRHQRPRDYVGVDF